VRTLEKGVENAEVVDHLQRRGVDGVATEIPEKVGVLLEHDYPDAGACQ
jgi:hypothetical protein